MRKLEVSPYWPNVAAAEAVRQTWDGALAVSLADLQRKKVAVSRTWMAVGVEKDTAGPKLVLNVASLVDWLEMAVLTADRLEMAVLTAKPLEPTVLMAVSMAYRLEMASQ